MTSGSLHLQAICEYRCKGPGTTFCKQTKWQIDTGYKEALVYGSKLYNYIK